MKFFSVLALLLIPASSVAIVESAREQSNQFVGILTDVFLRPLVDLLTIVALIVFMYGVFLFVANGDNEQGRENGKKHMMYGIIGLVIMVSARAIMRLFAESFGVADGL